PRHARRGKIDPRRDVEGLVSLEVACFWCLENRLVADDSGLPRAVGAFRPSCCLAQGERTRLPQERYRCCRWRPTGARWLIKPRREVGGPGGLEGGGVVGGRAGEPFVETRPRGVS